MNYRDRLSPWCIIQLLPKMQRSVVARFRKRHDAEAHLRALRRLNPALHYEIVFDPPLDDETPDALDTLAESLVLGQDACVIKILNQSWR
ncbi:hypothetical protein [Thermocoleostomius sinensis]|jgi:hypothetical protein|uniref:Uncharacterized protein n=1 Tax=Thermocoleostomius sinensis A174 TaxID=2016057 RepID=A0A9E8ZHU1_9CYAN|nr:hypothetical protein [Thermocoleostomius sinensis]WAL61992.1 hypothetical protein OXH18_08400 [Thermocoleostomius sinensis A174]